MIVRIIFTDGKPCCDVLLECNASERSVRRAVQRHVREFMGMPNAEVKKIVHLGQQGSGVMVKPGEVVKDDAWGMMTEAERYAAANGG